ncbi:MAG: phenylalanine--tRNA ligase subunit beta [Actinomycetota bacterium]
MRVPLPWLREFAPTDMDAETLAERMTHRGVKVEAVLYPWSGLDGVIAARVIEVRDHPNSEKLCVARLQHGSGEVELVVGVRNMGPGDLVPWAPPGARVPVLSEPLGTRVLRGVDSQGMLCSPRELAIGPDHGGILLLNDTGWEVGTDVGAALGLHEAVLDIEVEPNRPDFLSIYGVAREVAAATQVALAEPSDSVPETDEAASSVLSVHIEAPDRCPHYVARVIRGVSPGSSPLQVQARLAACGMRPIDAVVDATNYVMLEVGQPLHGFDLQALAGPGIVVRRAGDGERLTTLDEVDRTLSADDLVICDLERPVALAGVMGGRSSEVGAKTTDVLLESASFTRGGVLLTARRLDLHSEASHRFERGTDPEAVERAAARCAGLIAAWTGASVASGVAKDGTVAERRWVRMRPARAERLLGYAVSAGDAAAVFDELGMSHRTAADAMEVEVPGYRTDIDHEVDLIEEVVRIQGYERVGSSQPRSPQMGGVPEPYAFARLAKDALVRAGLREIRPMPFSSDEDLDLFGDRDAVEVANPLRKEEGFLRTRLTPGLLHAVARNRALGARRVALFEVGITFRLGSPYTEHRKAGFVLAGPAAEGWGSDGHTLDVLDAKGVLRSLLGELGVTSWALGPVPDGPFHPGRSAQILIGGQPVGVLGEIHPSVARRLGIEGRVAVGVVGLGAVAGFADRGFSFRDLPRFPPLRRDLAFVVPDAAAAGEVRDAIVRSAGELAEGCMLFDVYRGPGIPEGTKSLAFALDLRAPDRTLTDEEVAPLVDAIATDLRERLGAELRSG